MTVNLAEVRHLVRIVTTRTGNPIFDEDLAQEAAVRALEAIRRTGHVQHPRAFLMKIVSDTVRDYWRSRRRSEDLESIDPRLLSLQPGIEDELDRRSRAALLGTALQRLSPSKRRLIALFYNDGLTTGQIARLQKKSVSAVKMELMRARRQLARIVRAIADQSEKKSRLSRLPRVKDIVGTATQ
jgi:RNA polymerase sigma factor (sigma-70 family)